MGPGSRARCTFWKTINYRFFEFSLCSPLHFGLPRVFAIARSSLPKRLIFKRKVEMRIVLDLFIVQITRYSPSSHGPVPADRMQNTIAHTHTHTGICHQARGRTQNNRIHTVTSGMPVDPSCSKTRQKFLSSFFGGGGGCCSVVYREFVSLRSYCVDDRALISDTIVIYHGRAEKEMCTDTDNCLPKCVCGRGDWRRGLCVCAKYGCRHSTAPSQIRNKLTNAN